MMKANGTATANRPDTDERHNKHRDYMSRTEVAIQDCITIVATDYPSADNGDKVKSGVASAVQPRGRFGGGLRRGKIGA